MGLRVEIYRQAGTDLGVEVSDTVDHLTVVNIDGPDKPRDDAPAFTLERHHYYPEMPLLYPVDLTGREGMRGPMVGGNYAGTSDSRWHSALKKITGNRACALIAIHDRFEVVE